MVVLDFLDTRVVVCCCSEESGWAVADRIQPNPTESQSPPQDLPRDARQGGQAAEGQGAVL